MTNVTDLVTSAQGVWTVAVALGLTITGILIGIRLVKKVVK